MGINSSLLSGAGGAPADTTAPVLTLPTAVGTATTTATIGATTDDNTGTLYGVVTTSATVPTATQIAAGHDHTGSAAAFAGNVAVTSVGAKTISATGLTAGPQTYYAHLTHADVAGNKSNVVSSNPFSTYFAGETMVYGVTPPATGSNTGSGGTYIIAGRPIGRSGQITQFRMFANGSSTFKLKRFKRDGLQFTMVSEQSLNAVNGLNTYSVGGGTLTAVDVDAGDYIGLYSTTAAFLKYVDLGSALVTGTEYYATGADTTTTYSTGASTAPTVEYQMQVEWTVTVPSAPASAVTGTMKYIGEPSVATGTGATDGVTTYYPDVIFPQDVHLEDFSAYASAAGGAVMIFVLQSKTTGFSLLRAFTVTLASGLNSYTAGTDFPRDVIIPAGGMIGLWSLNGKLKADSGSPMPGRNQQGIAMGTIFPKSSDFLLFDNDNNISPQIKFGYKFAGPKNIPATMLDHTFSSVIHPTFLNTNWSIVSGKARNSSTGGASQLYFKYGGPFSGTVSAWVTFSGATDKVMVGRKPLQGGFGTLCSVDMSGHVLAIGVGWDGSSSLPGIKTSKTSTITFITGREYKIDFSNINGDLVATVTDTVTLATDSLTFSAFTGTGLVDYTAGRGWGVPCVVPITGTIDVSRMKFDPAVKQPSLIFIGDSLTDGSGANSEATSYPGYVRAMVAANNALIAGVGGTGTNFFINFLYQTGYWFYPEHVIWLGSHNDASYAVFQTNTTRGVEIAAMFTDMWLGTCLPEPADNRYETQFNPYLRANWPTKIISFDYAVTTGGTGLGADKIGADFYDSLHPNSTGYLAMANRIPIDAPSVIT